MQKAVTSGKSAKMQKVPLMPTGPQQGYPCHPRPPCPLPCCPRSSPEPATSASVTLLVTTLLSCCFARLMPPPPPCISYLRCQVLPLPSAPSFILLGVLSIPVTLDVIIPLHMHHQDSSLLTSSFASDPTTQICLCYQCQLNAD